MAKFFDTNEELVKLVNKKYEETGLKGYNLILKVMSTNKSKDIAKVTRAGAITEFLTKRDNIFTIILVESVLERLSEEEQSMMIEMALSNISYNSEKDKIELDGSPFNQIFRMRRKYGDKFVNTLETCYLIAEQIEEEEKQRKADEREAKKAKAQMGMNID